MTLTKRELEELKEKLRERLHPDGDEYDPDADVTISHYLVDKNGERTHRMAQREGTTTGGLDEIHGYEDAPIPIDELPEAERESLDEWDTLADRLDDADEHS